MKLYKTIMIWDCYVVAESHEAAREALKQFIFEEKLPPSEETALETRAESNVRESWRDQKPIVGADISDDDFENHVKGHTTIEVFQHIYQKR